VKLDPLQKNDIVSRWKNGHSLRAISRELGLGRHVVARVISQHALQTESADAASRPASLGPIRLTRKSKLDPFIDRLRQLLERYPQLTAQRAFEELRQLGYGGSYSSVRNHVKALRPRPKIPTVRFETAPGVQAQMDWSTYTLEFEQEGRRRVELFSYILGYSRLQYICFSERQDFETTVRQHIAAFEHLGGVAAVCLYDNMKVVVTGWEDGQPVYNTRFLSFATHYGFKPWACQPKRAETKGKVERPFDYVEKNLLNGRSFRSLEHLNDVARWWLSEVNDRRIHGTTKRTPLELHEQEQPLLIDLPTLRFDTAQVVYRNTTLHAAAIELQQFLPTSNHTAISNQPANPQHTSSQPAKLADS
jgi:transposase